MAALPWQVSGGGVSRLEEGSTLIGFTVEAWETLYVTMCNPDTSDFKESELRI